MSNSILWPVYAGLAGLAWGTYVPIIFFGGSEFGVPDRPPGANARLMAILCVGAAYFVIGVLFPLFMFLFGPYEWPPMKGTAITFSSLAGVAGAVGAICVIFASQAAVGAATDAGLTNKATFRVFIAPLIFGMAPVINTLVSTFWHPSSESAFHFAFEPPGWKLWVGILLVGAGAALVLYSKEEAELQHAKAAVKAPVAALPDAKV